MITLTGNTTITLDEPTKVSKKNIIDRAGNETLSGTFYEQIRFWKYEYKLDFELSSASKYNEIRNFLTNNYLSGTPIYFNYNKFAETTNLLVSLDLSDASYINNIVKYSLTIRDVEGTIS